MPSTSKKQHNFMAAVANNPAFAEKVGVPQSVGMDFNKADKGKKFSSEGRADLQKVAKQKTDHGKMAILKKGGEIMKQVDMKKNPGVAKLPTDVRNKMGFMKKGGMASDAKEDTKMDKGQDTAMIKKAFKQHDMQEHKGGKGTTLKLANGGSASARADGCATKGKTKGTMITMKNGGMC
jgi:hypothetical protein